MFSSPRVGLEEVTARLFWCGTAEETVLAEPPQHFNTNVSVPPGSRLIYQQHVPAEYGGTLKLCRHYSYSVVSVGNQKGCAAISSLVLELWNS